MRAEKNSVGLVPSFVSLRSNVAQNSFGVLGGSGGSVHAELVEAFRVLFSSWRQRFSPSLGASIPSLRRQSTVFMTNGTKLSIRRASPNNSIAEAMGRLTKIA